jgi:hypothetical protein
METNKFQEEEFRGFFQELKKKDEQLLIPTFPEMEKKGSRNWWIPVGIAASFALGFFLWPKEEKQTEPPAEVIIITLQENENQEQQILIEEKTYLDTWESQTESLLADY